MNQDLTDITTASLLAAFGSVGCGEPKSFLRTPLTPFTVSGNAIIVSFVVRNLSVFNQEESHKTSGPPRLCILWYAGSYYVHCSYLIHLRQPIRSWNLLVTPLVQ